MSTLLEVSSIISQQQIKALSSMESIAAYSSIPIHPRLLSIIIKSMLILE